MVRTIIDGNIFDAPSNWKELKSTFKRDEKARTILLSTDGRYDFSGDAFNYINDKINSDGFCTSLDVSFQDDCSGSWQEFIAGNIFLSDCEVNERTCVVTATVQDNSFYAKINNNKKIKTSPQAGRSKNNLSITPAATYNLDVYKQVDNTLAKSDVPAIRLYDCFRYFIDFMSDGTLSFTSSTFDVGGAYEGYCIVTGERLRLNTDVAFTQFNFEDLIKEVNNKIPLLVAIEKTSSSFSIRIESADYFDQQTTVYRFENIYEIKSIFETERLYAVLKLGGDVFEANNFYPEKLPLYGFQEEEFGLLGVCNIDNTLDISSKWITSPYIISNIITTSNQDFDSDIFIIDSILTDATNGRTRNSNYFGVSPAVYNYNEGLTNYQTVLRYFDRIPNGITSYFEPVGVGTFKANISTAYAPFTFPVQINVNFNNVVYNDGGYYNGVQTFTALKSGIFHNKVLIRVNVNTNTTGIYLRGYAEVEDGFSVIGQFNFDNITIGGTGTYELSGDFDINLIESQLLKITFVIYPTSSTFNFTFDAASYWEIDDNSLSGGIFQTFNPDDYPAREFEFDYPISKSEFNSIVSAPYGFAEFSQSGQAPRKGLIKELSYNHITSTANVKLITNKTTLDAN